MSRDVGIVEVIRRRIVEDGLGLEVKTLEDGVFAGAIGAALWAGWRHHELLGKSGAGRDEAETAAWEGAAISTRHAAPPRTAEAVYVLTVLIALAFRTPAPAFPR
jgi:hypothetical protein